MRVSQARQRVPISSQVSVPRLETARGFEAETLTSKNPPPTARATATSVRQSRASAAAQTRFRFSPRSAECCSTKPPGLQAETHQPLSWPYCQERSRPDSKTRARATVSQKGRTRSSRREEEGADTSERGRRGGRGRDVKTASRR